MIIKHGILFNFSRGQYLQDEEKPSYIAMFSAQSGFSELSEDSHISIKRKQHPHHSPIWLFPPQITSKQSFITTAGHTGSTEDKKAFAPSRLSLVITRLIEPIIVIKRIMSKQMLR